MSSTIDILIMVGQLILALSILVGVHEGGHLIAAKLFGMRVEQFSIGFPPKIFGFKVRDTEYSIGAIPLGGFVKISGMIDESLDLKTMQEEPKPWEFRSKPAWQRLIVMLGGIIVNVITGIVIFICLTYFIGESYISIQEINKYGIVPGPIGKELGFQTGDKIVAINDLEFERFNDIRDPGRLLESNSTYTVERNGEKVRLPIPPNFIERFSKLESEDLFLTPITEFTVGQVTPGKPAEKAGLMAGDKIVAIDSIPVKFYHEFRQEVASRAGKNATIQVQRSGSDNTTSPELMVLSVDIGPDSLMGFEALRSIQITEKKYGFAESIPIGAGRAFSVVWVNVKAFGRMFQGHLSPTKSLRGPLGIMKTFGVTWDWVRFWTLTGLISMILAFMNLLPIPALDGGHVMFLLYEIVSGRKPSDKFLENAQKVGMVLLLGLMVFVFFNDIVQEWFSK